MSDVKLMKLGISLISLNGISKQYTTQFLEQNAALFDKLADSCLFIVTHIDLNSLIAKLYRVLSYTISIRLSDNIFRRFSLV